MYEKMILARRVRMAMLVVFVLFVAWQKLWILAVIGLALMALTVWQTKRLREEIAVRTAAENAGVPYGPAANVVDDSTRGFEDGTGGARGPKKRRTH
ncbi:hypothetical protein ACFORJ_12220 [Corynebacterium hansenii]|uniref:Secreted protein n=1 Tax=Corynebacterium hansenii TaxID=394964 RepID=A0ABV7ZSS7_9CORY|nr:hypothetical protein [Corynebacterium hansenii]WJZ00068.1 hypothetical protein CHAN_07270 [Corynebacterium hansenii]